MSVLAKEIRKHTETSREFLQVGFKHSFKAGELLAEVESMVGAENLESWLSENNLTFEAGEVEQFLKLFRGESIKLSVATMKPEENKKEPKEKS